MYIWAGAWPTFNKLDLDLVPTSTKPMVNAVIATETHYNDEHESQENQAWAVNSLRLFNPDQEYGKDFDLSSNEDHYLDMTDTPWTLLPCPRTAGYLCSTCREAQQSYYDALIVAVGGYCTGKIGRDARMGSGVLFAPKANLNASVQKTDPEHGANRSTQRAELEAHFAVLGIVTSRVLRRLPHLRRVVINTDSEYAVENLTLRVGQGKVNEALFGRVKAGFEQLEGLGVRVQLWKVERNQNVEANTLAKRVC